MSSLGLHHGLLSDRARLDLLRRAIRDVVRPGFVVVDLGAGTGILGLLALKVARALAAENGFRDRVHYYRQDARRVKLPERADLVVADYVAGFGLDGDILDALIDARRFLKPGGRFLPERSEVWIAPVSAPGFHRRHVRPGSGTGLRMESFHALSANQIGFPGGSSRKVLAPFRRVASFRFPRREPVLPVRAACRFRVKPSTIHGLLVQVRVRYSPRVESNGRCGDYFQPSFLPVTPPLDVRAPRSVPVSFSIDTGFGVEWRVADRLHSTLFESYVTEA